MGVSSVKHTPKEGSSTWVFDESVAVCFDDMLPRSVPNYIECQDMIVRFSLPVLGKGGTVLDLGVSTASTFRRLHAALPKDVVCNYVGVDVSKPMLEQAEKNFPQALYSDTSAQEVFKYHPCNPKVVILSLTLQFIPIEHRQEIIRNCYNQMPKGSVLFLYEKCLGSDSWEEDLYTNYYYARKRSNGYSTESIQAKRKSLENVLVPVTYEFNRSLLSREGFKVVTLNRWCNFCLFAAYKL